MSVARISSTGDISGNSLQIGTSSRITNAGAITGTSVSVGSTSGNTITAGNLQVGPSPGCNINNTGDITARDVSIRSVVITNNNQVETVSTDNNSTRIASTAYVKNQGYAKVSTTNANYNLSGGGTVTWNANTKTVTWSQRVIAINLNISLARDGFFDIGPTNFTFGGGWVALYYVPTNGMGSAFDSTKLIQVGFPAEIGENWIFICSFHADNNSLRWNPGYVIIPNGGTYNANTGVSLRAKSWYITAGTAGNATTPAGSVLGSSNNSPSNIKFDSVSVQGNALASAWNTNTAIFTAPESGIYSFQLFCFVNYNTSGRWLSAKGTCVPQGSSQYLNFNIDFNTGTYGEGSFTTSVMFYMNAGETFYYGCDNTSPTLFYGQSHTGINILKII